LGLELRKFVEEEHAVMRQRGLAGTYDETTMFLLRQQSSA
jgi:hypothetical protein